MNYKTYAPSTDLSTILKCHWTLETPLETKPEKQRIVPDGCMEMIFHYGDIFKQYNQDGKFIIQPKCFIFGQISNTLEIEPTGKTGIYAVRFHPEGFSPFATIPLNEMENRAVPLQEIFGNEGLQIEKAILNATVTEERINIAETFLLNKLSSPEAIDRVVKSSVEILLQLNGQLPIDKLSEHLKVNRRQLERKFTSIIGLSPKQLSKIIKLQATLKMLAKKQFTSLTSVAYEGGYYDQAHFIKDFKEFTGMSPKNFYANNLIMSSLFLSDE
ncbi:MAG: AraC family transcriptional regulator [Saprospiraceae bacterium]|nr:AraC family transcriptional regulator [Saprospiraceae bacterium]